MVFLVRIKLLVNEHFKVLLLRQLNEQEELFEVSFGVDLVFEERDVLDCAGLGDACNELVNYAVVFKFYLYR